MLCVCDRFAYVDLAKAEDLDKAVALSGSEFEGQQIVVEEAKPRTQGTPRTPMQQRDSEGRNGAIFGIINLFFFFFFFAFPSYVSGVHHFWVRFLHM